MTQTRKPALAASRGDWYDYATSLGLAVFGFSKRNIQEEVAQFESRTQEPGSVAPEPEDMSRYPFRGLDAS